MTTTDIDDFTRGYIECALWLADETPDSGEWRPHGPYTIENIDTGDLKAMIEDCQAFQQEQGMRLSWAYQIVAGKAFITPAQAGIDFHLSRNRHGSGFLDRDLGAIGKSLQDAAHAYGESSLFLADDGRLYLV